jgi:hypothetical protein
MSSLREEQNESENRVLGGILVPKKEEVLFQYLNTRLQGDPQAYKPDEHRYIIHRIFHLIQHIFLNILLLNKFKHFTSYS